MTRGALTTFSIANDVAKYFAIIPAMFLAFYPQLGALNVMGLASPQSAILSAIIFNALIIIALIPLALRGVALPRGRRRRAAAPQPADLRPRRHRRALRRHQADRPRRHRPAPRLIGLASEEASTSTRCFVASLLAMTRNRSTMLKNSPRPRPAPRADRHHRACLSARHDRPRRRDLPGAGRRQPDRARRQGRRLRPDRPAFTADRYFHGRPSATTAPDPAIDQDRAGALQRRQLGGSNLGPTSEALIERVKRGRRQLKAENPAQPVPIDLVTTSAAGSTRTSRRRPRCSRCRASPRRAACRRTAVAQLVDRQYRGPPRSASSASRASMCSRSTSRSTPPSKQAARLTLRSLY